MTFSTNELPVKNYKFITFILFLFPYLMYTYSSTIPMLYFSNLGLITSILAFVTLSLGIRKNAWEHETPFFAFLFYITVFSILFIRTDLVPTVKYISFFLIYIFLMKPYFSSLYWYRLYVDIITVISIGVLIVFMLYSLFGIGKSFEPQEISELMSAKSALMTRDWGYKIPFYFVVISEKVENGLLGVQRVLGISHEPTAFATILLPAFFLAFNFKKYISASILLLTLLLTSSYGSFVIILIGFLFIYFYRYRKVLLLMGALGILSLLFFSDSIFGPFLQSQNPRLELYAKIFSNLSHQQFHLITFQPFTYEGKGSLDVPAFFDILLSFGFVGMTLYFWILWHILKKSENLHNKIIYGMMIATILMINKGQLALSPLFFFVVNFLNIKRVSK